MKHIRLGHLEPYKTLRLLFDLAEACMRWVVGFRCPVPAASLCSESLLSVQPIFLPVRC
jgi:hypothetical protein